MMSPFNVLFSHHFHFLIQICVHFTDGLHITITIQSNKLMNSRICIYSSRCWTEGYRVWEHFQLLLKVYKLAQNQAQENRMSESFQHLWVSLCQNFLSPKVLQHASSFVFPPLRLFLFYIYCGPFLPMISCMHNICRVVRHSELNSNSDPESRWQTE